MKLSENTLNLMKEITQISGVPGNEKEISRVLQGYYRKYTNEIVFDNLGSLYGVKRSKKKNVPKVMIAAHMDEIGFIVKGINDNGLIKTLALGSAQVNSLLGQRVIIKNEDGKEFIGVLCNGLKTEDTIKVDKLLVDIGASSKEEVKSLGIRFGDSIVVEGKFEVLSNGKRLLSKAWDNRYGCIMGIEILEALKDVDLDFDLYVGCTVQEEVGLRGAQTSVNLVRPDLAIVLDCLEANDILKEEDTTGKLGDGVLVKYYDKSMMPNRALLNHLVDTCRNNKIKYQYYYSMGDSDAGWIHKLRVGCPTLVASICARNVNTNSSIIDVDDYIASKNAVLNVIESLDSEKIKFFKEENR